MVTVYYDSAVQTTFVELVKFIRGSRNAMRKGKMQAKMIDMRAAVQEMDDDNDDDDKQGFEVQRNTGKLIAPQKKFSSGNQEESLAVRDTGNSDTENLQDLSIAKLRFASTRNMGRTALTADNLSTTLGSRLPRGYERSGIEDAPGIFDELDKGLEWSQGQCERAAHQLLRDGECSMEIENAKRKLAEVKKKAEKEVERLKGGEK
jgi:chaperonin cofactor prefoldin